MMKTITPERLKEIVLYDSETGIFVWKIKKSRSVIVGKEIGCLNEEGYVTIGVDGKYYPAHRLAWLYMTGEWPKYSIDHINGERSDNRWGNLRDVPTSINNQNRRNVKGFSYDKYSVRHWRVRIRFGGKKLHIGTYETQEEAHAAYLEAKRRLHPGCTI